jgi:hypothetical protein
MSILGIAILSFFSSLLFGYFVNAVLNNGFGFLKDNEFFINKYNFFQVILPSFLILFSILCIIFDFNGLFPRVVQLLFTVYVSVILFWYNRNRNNKRKLNRIKDTIIKEIIIPWKIQTGLENEEFSLNVYFFNKRIKGEVVFFMNPKINDSQQVLELKNKLIATNISLVFRERGKPKVYKMTK